MTMADAVRAGRRTRTVECDARGDGGARLCRCSASRRTACRCCCTTRVHGIAAASRALRLAQLRGGHTRRRRGGACARSAARPERHMRRHRRGHRPLLNFETDGDVPEALRAWLGRGRGGVHMPRAAREGKYLRGPARRANARRLCVLGRAGRRTSPCRGECTVCSCTTNTGRTATPQSTACSARQPVRGHRNSEPGRVQMKTKKIRILALATGAADYADGLRTGCGAAELCRDALLAVLPGDGARHAATPRTRCSR